MTTIDATVTDTTSAAASGPELHVKTAPAKPGFWTKGKVIAGVGLLTATAAGVAAYAYITGQPETAAETVAETITEVGEQLSQAFS